MKRSGVHQLKRGSKRWKAQVTFKRKKYHLGYYTTREEAEDAYAESIVRIARKLIHRDIQDVLNSPCIKNCTFTDDFPLS